jgi:dipeptidyl aminopeptidase/acylaminoacyl peptidase
MKDSKHPLYLPSFLFGLLAFGLLSACVSTREPDGAKIEDIATDTATVIPMRDFFKNPERADYQVSPDGRHLAYLAPFETRMNVFVQNLSKEHLPIGTAKRVTSIKDRDVHGFFWKGNRHLVYVRDTGGDENYHLFSTEIATGATRDLTPFPKVRAQIIDDLVTVSDNRVVIGLNKENPELFDVYELDVPTGKLTLSVKNFAKITSWVTDHAGTIRLAVSSDGLNTVIYHRPVGGQFKEIMKFDFKDSFRPQFFTFDNKFLYAISNLGRDHEAAVRVDPNTGKELEVLYENPSVDVGGLTYSLSRKVLSAAYYYDWKRQFEFFDGVAKVRYKTLADMLPNREIILVSRNRAEDVFIVATSSDRSSGGFYLYDEATTTLTPLADAMPWLKENNLAEVKPVEYQSRDGLTIHGYLTLPKGSKATNLPVVVVPHGGPWHRDVWGFDPEVQFLANRGYAVFQMNFRGSTGYGKKFWTASFKQWGKKMQDDITDGVNWLIKQNIANPKRVAIYGASYGGYATLAGLAFTPDLYACGVDYVGISNLFTFMDSIPPYWRPYLEKVYAMVGNPKMDKDLLRSASPIFFADQIRAPLLVAQGANDPRVKKSESDQMVDSLKKRGIHVPYLIEENEGHGFHNEENRFKFYETMEAFLGQHLKG